MSTEKVRKILIVDDEQLIRDTVAMMVEEWGYAALKCGSGKAALELLKENSDIALVITDMVMPEMDGRAFIKAVRDQEVLKDLPVIIISGVVKLSELSGILDQGASYFVPKPINHESLEHYVKNLLDKPASEKEA